MLKYLCENKDSYLVLYFILKWRQMPFRFFTQNVMFGWCEVKKKEIGKVILVDFFGFK